MALSLDRLIVLPRPDIVLREEADEWAILYDPDTGKILSVNPLGAVIWRHLDGIRTGSDIVALVRDTAENVPEGVEADVRAFLEATVALGLSDSVSSGEEVAR